MKPDNLTYKIAVGYYERGLTQQEIANRYGISRIKVSRLLSQAQKEKVVQVRIVPPEDPFADLETRLEERYGLDHVIVAGSRADDFQTWLDKVGRVAADYVASILTGTETVGLTWGRALLSIISNLPAMNFPDLKIVQMVGGLGEPQSEFHGADLCRKMAQACGSRPWLIQAPGIVKNPEICRALKEDIQVKGTLELGAKADIALVGIGLFGEGSPLVESDTILTPKDRKTLGLRNAAGDISLRFFDGEGRFISTELDERIVGLTTGEIRKLKRIIGIAGGREKYRTVRAAVRKRLIHVLITDPRTAERLEDDAQDPATRESRSTGKHVSEL